MVLRHAARVALREPNRTLYYSDDRKYTHNRETDKRVTTALQHAPVTTLQAICLGTLAGCSSRIWLLVTPPDDA